MATSIPPSGKKFNRSPASVKTRQVRQRLVRSTSNQIHPSRRSLIHPSRLRLMLVWAILVVCSLGLAVNLLRLQVFDAAKLQAQAQGQQMVSVNPFVPRRAITDRVGNVLAIDRPVYTLFAHPNQFKIPPAEIAAKLAPLLNRSTNDLIRQFSSAESGIRLEYVLTELVAREIINYRLDGLELLRYQQRLYPQGQLFVDVVGYVNDERQGQAGVEYSQQDLLQQPTQEVELFRTGEGAILPTGLPDDFLRQDHLHLKLSLDSRLQRTARLALEQQIQQFGAKQGTVLVMDVRDGAIVSMVTEPSYDPNEYYQADPERMRNWAVSDLYEPGSTFKPINVAIALEQGVIKPEDVFNDEGQIEIGGWPIENYDYTERGGRGVLNVAEIIKYSSNVGMVHIMQRLQPQVYYDWLEKLGLNGITGIDLPSEAEGLIKEREQFVGAAIEPATTAFGQGFSLTPIRLLQLHAALANGGRLVTPHVVQGLFHDDGQPYWQPEFPAPTQVFSPQTTQTVLAMMEGVVTDGTGAIAQIPGYRIGGKTGTAQKAVAGGYDENARITSFVSVFPIEAPRYVVLVVINEPKGEDAYGSTVAAPIAKVVLEGLIRIEQILPSQPLSPIVEPSPEL